MAAPIVVWLEPAVPDEKAVAKAENDAGEAVQLSHVDLAFPPEPVGPADDAAYQALTDEVAEARERWEEFEVEVDIATQLEAAFDGIRVVRDDRDAAQIVEARALQGAAVFRGFDPVDFAEGTKAEPFRFVFPGDSLAYNGPWLEALAIDRDHKLGADVADQATYTDLQKLQTEVAELPSGFLDLSALPAGAKLVVDGRPVQGAGKHELRPGTHYLHVDRDGVVSGRARVEVAPEATIPLPMLVSADELAQARAQVVEGSTTGFPEDVKKALDALSAHHGGAVFVASVDDGKVTVLPYARGAALLRRQVVTVVGAGDIGATVIVSPLFDESEGELTTAPGVSGALGLEIGIYNGVILGGMDLAFTPANTVTYGNSDLTENVSTSALPQPWGGLGLYLLRPIGAEPYVLLAGTYGWNGPAHLAMGARATVGLPMRDEGAWLRITLGGSTASKSMWDEELGAEVGPMHVGFLRVGLAQRF